MIRLGTTLPYRSPPGKICGVFEGSSCPAGPDDLLNVVNTLGGLGFEHVELCADMFMYNPTFMSAPVMDRLCSAQERFGLTFSLHLCEYFGMTLESLDEDVRRASVVSSLKAIKAVRPLGVQHIVVHIAGAWPWVPLIAVENQDFPECARAELMERIVEQSRSSLHTLIQEVPARMLCLENLALDFQWTARLVQEFNTSICFDGGHWAGLGRPLTEFVELYGSRIAEVHCHDVQNGVDHRPLCTRPGETPVLDWERALTALVEKGFEGPVVLEFYGLEGKACSLQYLRQCRRQAWQK